MIYCKRRGRGGRKKQINGQINYKKKKKITIVFIHRFQATFSSSPPSFSDGTFYLWLKNRINTNTEDNNTNRFFYFFHSSYGKVFKALNNRNGQLFAIKCVPIEAEMAEVEKEILILKQCQSPYIVNYYGSYRKELELWVS